MSKAEVKWMGDWAKAAAKSGATAGLTAAAEYTLAQSREIVPLEEATLSRSGAVDVDATLGVATVSYDTPYAVRQHEELGYRHDAGRKAKYLEIPVTSTREIQAEIIARHMRRAFND